MLLPGRVLPTIEPMDALDKDNWAVVICVVTRKQLEEQQQLPAATLVDGSSSSAPITELDPLTHLDTLSHAAAAAAPAPSPRRTLPPNPARQQQSTQQQQHQQHQQQNQQQKQQQMPSLPNVSPEQEEALARQRAQADAAAEQLRDKLQLLHDARHVLADLREQKNAAVIEKQRVLQVQQPRRIRARNL
jgi:hypothetical protein